MKEQNTYNEELGGKNLPDSLRVNPFLIPNNFFEEQEERILSQIHVEHAVRDINESVNENATATVPDGYFNTLENSIFARIAEQDLKDQASTDGFTVPDQYFDALSQNIKASITEDKLKSIVPVLDFPISEDYFNSAEEQILARISEFKLREQVGNDSGFITPASYFEEVSEQIEAKIIVDKWPEVLNKEYFTVPSGYFDQLSEKILAKTTSTTKQETTIFTLPKRTNWRKYSAAAAIAMVVGIGSYLGFQNNVSNSTSRLSASEVNVEHLSDEEILNYLAQVSEGEDLIHLSQYASDSEDENVQVNDHVQLDSEIDNKEIEEYLNYML